MERSSLPYIFSFGMLILIKCIFAYLEYRRSAKRYVKEFRKTLIRHGIPRKEAKELASAITIIGIGDFSRVLLKRGK